MSPWSFDGNEPDLKRRIEKVITYYHDPSKEYTADTEVAQNLKVLSATVRQVGPDEDPYVARTVFTLPVMPTWLNAMRNMHGGIVALLVDVATTMTLSCIVSCNEKGEWFWQYPGVSRNLSVTFLKPIPADITLRVETVITGIGKRVASIQALIRDHKSGDLLCTGQHDKVNIQPPARVISSRAKL